MTLFGVATPRLRTTGVDGGAISDYGSVNIKLILHNFVEYNNYRRKINEYIGDGVGGRQTAIYTARATNGYTNYFSDSREKFLFSTMEQYINVDSNGAKR